MSQTIAYVRVSTERQEDGNGPAQQRSEICAWAVANGCKIDDWAYESESGTIEDREIIQGLLAQAKRGQLARLVIDRMDRLGRTLLVCERLYKAFLDAGVEIVCVKQAIKNTPSGALIRQIMGAIAEYQRSEWLSRMRVCRRNVAAAKGLSPGGTDPYGYRSVGNGKLEIDEATAPMVRKAFLLHDVRQLSLRGIADLLSRDGFRTTSGKPLTHKTIAKILARRDFYAGRAPLYDIELAEGVQMQHPALITEGGPSMHGTQSETVMEKSN